MWLGPLGLLLLDDLLEFLRYRRNRQARDLHAAVRSPLRHDVERAEFGDLVRIILAEVSAAALFPLERRDGDRLGDVEQVADVDRRVPAGVILTVPFDTDA